MLISPCISEVIVKLTSYFVFLIIIIERADATESRYSDILNNLFPRRLKKAH